MWVSIHGGEAGQCLVSGAAPGIGLQEELLVGAKISHSHLVVEELKRKKGSTTLIGWSRHKCSSNPAHSLDWDLILPRH